MVTISYTNKTANWLGLYKQIASYLSQPVTIQANFRNCDIFFCSYSDVTEISHYSKAFVIFISGEPTKVTNRRIDLIIDCKIVKQPIIPSIYFPFYAYSFLERKTHKPESLIKNINSESAYNLLKGKSKFCAFMYRYSIKHRDSLFDQLTHYKTVDAIGKAKNKTPGATFKGSNPYDDAVQRYLPYKFVICCENHSVDGYVTEKIVNAMLANAIPIYWGSPDIVKHFNPESFINATTNRQWVEKVKQLDKNNTLYCEMLSKPWLNGNQLNEYLKISQNCQKISQKINSKMESSKREISNNNERSALINKSRSMTAPQPTPQPIRMSTSPRNVSHFLHHKVNSVVRPRLHNTIHKSANPIRRLSAVSFLRRTRISLPRQSTTRSTIYSSLKNPLQRFQRNNRKIRVVVNRANRSNRVNRLKK